MQIPVGSNNQGVDMRGNGKWLALAVAAGTVAACEQNPVAVADSAEFTPAFAVTVPTISVGELWLCKEADSDATYTFEVTATTGNVSVAVGAQFELGQDDCEMIATSTGGTVTIEEVNQPAGTQFVDVANYVHSGTNGASGVPVLDNSFTPNPSTTNPASSRNFGEDFGRLLLFRNMDLPTGGCTLTLGYWKTHSENGPAPFDATWAELPAGASTIFFLSGSSWYEVFWTPVAGNQYYNLAHQYMAAALNMEAGASVPANVQTAFDAATTLFNTYTPADIAGLPGNDALRAQFVALAGILGSYNEGDIGPGHCAD
jgi:hypothetical protein